MSDNGILPDIPIETIAETASYTIWAAKEPDGERTYHLELGPVTAHFFNEEWRDFIQLIRQAVAEEQHIEREAVDDEETATEVELDWGTLYFVPDEWTEFLQLIEQV